MPEQAYVNSSIFNISSSNNSTEFHVYGPFWTLSTCLSLFVQITALLTNGSLAILFVLDRSLITPFLVYVINLSIGNVLSSLVFNSLELVKSLYSKWWLGEGLCTFYQYAQWIFAGGICNAHALIALNRFWAVTFPNSYRQFHTIQNALKISFAMWLYMHACVLPGILVDAVVYRRPVQIYGCNTGATKSWQITAQILIFDVPLLVIFGVFPVVCYKAMNRLRRPAIQPISQNSTKATPLPSTSQPSVPTSFTQASPAVGNVQTDRPRSGRKDAREKTNRGLLALTAMTITVLVCYAPDNIYGTLWVLGMDIDGMYSVVSVMYAMTPVIDPVWFIITLPELRRAFLRTYLRRTV